MYRNSGRWTTFLFNLITYFIIWYGVRKNSVVPLRSPLGYLWRSRMGTREEERPIGEFSICDHVRTSWYLLVVTISDCKKVRMSISQLSFYSRSSVYKHTMSEFISTAPMVLAPLTQRRLMNCSFMFYTLNVLEVLGGGGSQGFQGWQSYGSKAQGSVLSADSLQITP